MSVRCLHHSPHRAACIVIVLLRFGTREARVNELLWNAGDLVKDKDGISAAAVFYEMAATLRREETMSVAQVRAAFP